MLGFRGISDYFGLFCVIWVIDMVLTRMLRTFVNNLGKPLRYHRGDNVEVFLGY